MTFLPDSCCTILSSPQRGLARAKMKQPRASNCSVKMIQDLRSETPVTSMSLSRGEVKADCTFPARQSAHSFNTARSGRIERQ